MNDSIVVPLRQPETIDVPLMAILRSGVRRLIAQAIEAEAEVFLAQVTGLPLPGRRERMIRHGYGPKRLVKTGIGPVAVRRVKLRDRAEVDTGDRIRFTSSLLPR